MSDFCKNCGGHEKQHTKNDSCEFESKLQENEITEEIYNKIGYFKWPIEKREEYQRAVGFYMDRKGSRPSDTWIERWHQFYEERKKEEEPSEEYIGLKKRLEKIGKDIVETRREFETLPEFVSKYTIEDIYDLFGEDDATFMVTAIHYRHGKIHRHFNTTEEAREYAKSLLEERSRHRINLFAFKDIKLERVEVIETWEREG